MTWKASALALALAMGMGAAQAQMPAQAAPMARAGMWDFSMDAKVDAAPDFQFPAQSQQRCMTAEDAKSPASLVGGLGVQGAQGCVFTKSAIMGNRLDFEMSCSGGLDLSSRGSVTFAAESIDGRIVTKMKAADGMVEFKSTLTGRRVGECH